MVVFLPFLVESLYSTIVNQKAYECKRDREFVELLDKEEAQFYNGYVTDRNWYIFEHYLQRHRKKHFGDSYQSVFSHELSTCISINLTLF